MPYRPKKPCRHPGCAKLTDGRYCEEHISLHPEVTRSAAKRGYGSKWRKESKSCHDKKTGNEDSRPTYSYN